MPRNENISLRKTVFTSFSKSVKDAFGLSFSRSARDNCGPCRLWTSCYASRIERIYSSLESKLATHYQNGPIWTVNRAIAQLPNKPLRWARLSVDGSLPSKRSMHPKRWRSFIRQLRILIQKAKLLGAQWHIPVESMPKAKAYRKALKGLNVVVRRTSQAPNIKTVLEATDLVAWTVATKIHNGHVGKDEVKRNADLAAKYATQIRRAGKTCVICPAIVSKSLCGQCTACASPNVDVVLYPFHP